MIGSAYTSLAVQSILGPEHSLLIPDVLWGGLLDEDFNLIAMTGVQVHHEAFGPTTNGVHNIAIVDAGVAGDSWDIRAFAIYDAAEGGQILLIATVTPATPEEDEPLFFAIGDLVFTFLDSGIES